MHESLRLYDGCLDLLTREAEALANEDEETLEELCAKRERLMASAWARREGCDPHLLAQKLEAVLAAQAGLIRKTEAETEELRETLKKGRKENNRMSGYGKVVNNRQKAMIVSKEG